MENVTTSKYVALQIVAPSPSCSGLIYVRCEQDQFGIWFALLEMSPSKTNQILEEVTDMYDTFGYQMF